MGLFFEQCCHCLRRDGSSLKSSEVHVTLKGGEPYASWKVGPTAGKATDGKDKYVGKLGPTAGKATNGEGIE
jgi:hypothetical protein